MPSFRSLIVIALLSALPVLADESPSPASPASAEATPAPETPADAASAAANVVPPEVKDGHVHSPSGEFTIALPEGWRLADEPKQGAQCDVENDDNGDVFVETDEKDEDLADYMNRMVAGMKQSQMKKLEETGRKDVTVAGFKGLQARIAATNEKGDELEYIVTLFNSERLMYHIVGITSKADLEKNEKAMLAIVDSFKIGK